jgi:hypothetical protein
MSIENVLTGRLLRTSTSDNKETFERPKWDKICTELNNLNGPFSDQELSSNECGVNYVRNTT